MKKLNISFTNVTSKLRKIVEKTTVFLDKVRNSSLPEKHKTFLPICSAILVFVVFLLVFGPTLIPLMPTLYHLYLLIIAILLLFGIIKYASLFKFILFICGMVIAMKVLGTTYGYDIPYVDTLLKHFCLIPQYIHDGILWLWNLDISSFLK